MTTTLQQRVDAVLDGARISGKPVQEIASALAKTWDMQDGEATQLYAAIANPPPPAPSPPDPAHAKAVEAERIRQQVAEDAECIRIYEHTQAANMWQRAQLINDKVLSAKYFRGTALAMKKDK